MDIGQATGCHSAECSSSSRTFSTLHWKRSELFPFSSRVPERLGPSLAPDFPKRPYSSVVFFALSTDDRHHRGVSNERRPQVITPPSAHPPRASCLHRQSAL